MTNGEKIPAPIAQAIDAGGKKAQYDAEAKQFLSNVEILSRIMKRVVPEFKGMDLGEIKKCILKPTVGTELLDEGLTNITGENTESNIPSEGYVTFDIKFSARADSNPRGKVILDMEMQRKKERFLPRKPASFPTVTTAISGRSTVSGFFFPRRKKRRRQLPVFPCGRKTSMGKWNVSAGQTYWR